MRCKDDISISLGSAQAWPFVLPEDVLGMDSSGWGKDSFTFIFCILLIF